MRAGTGAPTFGGWSAEPVAPCPSGRSFLRRFLVLGLIVVAAPAAAQAHADSTALAESTVEQRPQVVPGSCAAPSYPVQMRAGRIEGRVVLQFVVDTTGRIEPGSIVVLQSTHRLFETSARRALQTCRYRPARFANRPVRVRVESPYNFRVTGS